MTPRPQEPGRLRAGVARSDITTDAEGRVVHDRLYAKALVLSDGTTQAVLVSMDAVAIGGICEIKDDFLPTLRRRIENELAIPGEHVLVCATHTHPPEPILCSDEEQVERTFDAVRRAAQSLEPVTVGAGRGREDRIAINRNLKLSGGGHWTIRQTNPCPPDERIEGLGPVDPEIGVLRIDRVGGGTLAVVYNFACHPLIGVPGAAVTGNYPGFASRVIEENLGGATALFLQGAAGDVTEVLYKDVNRPADAEPIGAMLGLSTLRAIRDIQTRDGDLRLVSETIRLPRRTDTDERVAALLQQQDELLRSLRFTSLNLKSFVPLYVRHALDPRHPADYAYRYLHAEEIGDNGVTAMDARNREQLDKYVRNIHAMEQLARIQDELATYERHRAINEAAGEATIDAEVMGIRIGDCALISAPIELLTEVGLKLKRESPHAHTLIAGFANGYMHYGAPAADYDKGGYEVTECLLAPEWQAAYEGKAIEILNRLNAPAALEATGSPRQVEV